MVKNKQKKIKGKGEDITGRKQEFFASECIDVALFIRQRLGKDTVKIKKEIGNGKRGLGNRRINKNTSSAWGKFF
jgi:hypothetical protein